MYSQDVELGAEPGDPGGVLPDAVERVAALLVGGQLDRRRDVRKEPPELGDDPSDLRTKALHILRGTGDLQTVRALLGHVQIESTARYLGLNTKSDPIAVCRAFDF